MNLYHYTCSHGADALGDAGTLRPTPHLLFDPPLSLLWATDMAEPDAQALGLTSTILDCDRTRVRYLIVAGVFEPWLTSQWRRRLDSTGKSCLEVPPLQPSRWWVSNRSALAIRSMVPAAAF